MNAEFTVGDFIMFTDDTKEVYPGRILDIKQNGKYKIEIFVNQQADMDIEIIIVEASDSQIKKKSITK